MTNMTVIDISDPGAKSHGILRGSDWWEEADYPWKRLFGAEEEQAAAGRGITLEKFRELCYDGNRVLRSRALGLIAAHRSGTLHSPYSITLAMGLGNNWMLIDQLPTYPDPGYRSNADE